MDSEGIKIYQPRDNILKVVLLFTGIIIALLWLVYYEFNLKYSIDRMFLPFFTVVEGIVILFLFFAIIILMKKLALKEPFMTFTKDNIISQGIVPECLIDMNDLQWYKNTTISHQEFIIIKLRKDSLSYENIPFITKMLFKHNLNTYGGEIGLSEAFLRESYLDVMILLDEKNIFKIN